MRYRNRYAIYKAGHWKFTSNGVIELPPIEKGAEINNGLELPFLLLSILIIVEVVLTFFQTI